MDSIVPPLLTYLASVAKDVSQPIVDAIKEKLQKKLGGDTDALLEEASVGKLNGEREATLTSALDQLLEGDPKLAGELKQLLEPSGAPRAIVQFISDQGEGFVIETNSGGINFKK